MWVLPTFGRPGRCQETLDSIGAAFPTKGLVVVDGDPDPAYRTLRTPAGWSIALRPENQGVCAVLNCVLAAYPYEPWYGFISDDSIVATADWSAPLIEAAGRHGFANSADGFRAHLRMHGAVVFGGDLLRAIGWWAPPGLVHCYVDDAWERLGRALGNWRRVPSVLVEHRHTLNGKAALDDTYRQAYASLGADRTAFQRMIKEALPPAIARADLVVAAALDPEARRLIRAKSRSVMIGVPIARAPCWQFTMSFSATVAAFERLGIPYATCPVIGSSNLPRARNEIAARFIASGMSDLLFIDDDMSWKAPSVVRLLASDKPLVAAVGRKKVDVPTKRADVWCCKFPDDAFDNLEQDDMGNVRVDRVGTGFMRIERTVFEALIYAHPEWKGHPNPEMPDNVKAAYFRFFRFGEEEMGEDYVFCERWKDLGGEIWIDPTVGLGHTGEKTYEGCIADIMQPEEPLAAAAE